jgi:hypothetical protein
MGHTPLDCNDAGVLTMRSDVADPATGNKRKRAHAPLCRPKSAGSGHVTATYLRKLRESHSIGGSSTCRPLRFLAFHPPLLCSACRTRFLDESNFAFARRGTDKAQVHQERGVLGWARRRVEIEADHRAYLQGFRPTAREGNAPVRRGHLFSGPARHWQRIRCYESGAALSIPFPAA